MGSFVKRISCAAISFYQKAISPWMGHRCRFYPSCSEYTKTAIQKMGFFKGSIAGIRRILSCHPFHPGGYDPVAETDLAVKQ